MEQISKKYNEKSRQAYPNEFENDGKQQLYTNVVLAHPDPSSFNKYVGKYTEDYSYDIKAAEERLLNILLDKYKGCRNYRDEATSWRENSFLVPSGAEIAFREDAFKIFDLVRVAQPAKNGEKYDVLNFTHSENVKDGRVEALYSLGKIFDAKVNVYAGRNDKNEVISKVLVNRDQKYQFITMFKNFIDILNIENPQPAAANDTGPSL